jgi:acetylornithine deacetylase/succinyl-diaminopimelate desuccinylase-like protein
VALQLRVRTAERNLHSGMYGGSVLNALHVLHGMLAQVLPGPDGRVREELRQGITPPSAAEIESWERLPSGETVITDAGAQPVHRGAGAEYYMRNGADAALDVNEIVGGEPRTVIPAQAGTSLSLRLAPGQDEQRMCEVLQALLRDALPDGAELEISSRGAAPALFDPDQPALALAADALARACGVTPVFVRTGGSIPVVAEMSGRGYPVVVTGFGLPDDQVHAPDESYALRSLEWGKVAAEELYTALAALPSSAGRPASAESHG